MHEAIRLEERIVTNSLRNTWLNMLGGAAKFTLQSWAVTFLVVKGPQLFESLDMSPMLVVPTLALVLFLPALLQQRLVSGRPTVLGYAFSGYRSAEPWRLLTKRQRVEVLGTSFLIHAAVVAVAALTFVLR